MTEWLSDIYLFTRRYPFLSVLAVSTIIIACVLCFLPVRFEENDDICMLLIASGGYSGTPDAHLIFINYIYGLGLKTLYTLYQGVEWYTLLFVILHALSISILLLSVIKAIENKALKILFVVLFWSIELQILLHLQFTTTAALVCLAGVALLLEQQTSRRVAGVILCVIGSWLRLEISLVVLFISFPLFLKELLVHRKLLLSGALAYLGVSVLLIGAFEMIDQASYCEEGGWKDYLEYNKVRGRLNDNPNASALADRLPQGIEPVDYALLLRFFQDGTVLNSEKLNLLYNKLSFDYSNSKFNGALSSLAFYKKYFLLLVIIVALSIVSARAKSDRMVLLASMFLFALVAFAMALTVSLKYRIFLSAVLPLLYSISRSVNRSSDLSVKLLSVFSLLLCFYSTDYVYQFIGQNRYLKNKIVEQHAFAATYLARSTSILVPYAADYRTEGTPVFSVSDMHFKKRLFFGGWLTNIPLNNSYYTSHYDFVKGHSLFLRQASRTILPLLVESIYTNYGARVEPVVVAESADDVIVEFKAI